MLTVRMPAVWRGQQCEWAKSANFKCANVRAEDLRCDIGAKKVRQQCVNSAHRLFFSNFWYWYRISTERKKGSQRKECARWHVVPLELTFFFLRFSLRILSTPSLQCLCVPHACARGKKGRGKPGFVYLQDRWLVSYRDLRRMQRANSDKEKANCCLRREHFATMSECQERAYGAKAKDNWYGNRGLLIESSNA